MKDQTKTASIEQISVDKLDEIIRDNTFNIIDVRDSMSIKSQGSIPGAINIPFDRIDNSIDREHPDYHLVFDSKDPLLFCCTGGVMSYMAAIKAQQSGIRQVFNLEGGHAAWKKSNEVLAEI